MKIFIPFQLKDIGGTSTFAKKFKSGLEEKGHEVFFEFRSDYDVLFIIVSCPFSYILHAKWHKKRIIQRLDGVYYWSVAGWKYPFYNLKAQLIHLLCAEATVYQSEYSRSCVQRFLGRNNHSVDRIIYNGVDLKKFSPDGEKINLRRNPGQQIFFTASKFRRKDQILPILNALEIYREESVTDFRFLIAGSFQGEVADIPEKFATFPGIEFLGKIQNDLLPRYLRSADTFLFTHLNPPCPNNVIEAMACGLPICGVADGAMPELVRNAENGLLVESEGEAFWKKRTIDIQKFSTNITSIMRNRRHYSDNAVRITKQKFSLDNMINNYIDILFP